MATPADQIQPEPQEHFGSVDALEANARAILETAPTLDQGINALSSFYQSFNWDKEDQAKLVAEKYGDLLRHRFKDDSLFSDKDLATIAPVSFSEAKPLENPTTDTLKTVAGGVVSSMFPIAGDLLQSQLSPEQEKQIQKINGWEQQNLEALNNQGKENSLNVTNKTKLINSIKDSADKQRREVYTTGQNPIGDVGYRFLEGALGSTATAASNFSGWETPKNYIDYLKEHTKDAEGSDLSAYAANTIKGLASGLGWVAGVETGGVPFMLATGASSTYNTFYDSLVKSGDRSQAYEAGAVQAVNQIFQNTVGAKLLGAEASKAGSGLGQVIEGFITKGTKFGGLGVVGQVMDNIAQNVGEGRKATEEFLKGVPQAAASNILLGGLVEGVKKVSQPGAPKPSSQNPPPSNAIEPEGVPNTEGPQAPPPNALPPGSPPLLGLPSPDIAAGQGFQLNQQGQGNTEGLTSYDFRPQTQRALPAPGYENFGERGVGPIGAGVNRLTPDGKFYINSQGKFTKVPYNPQGFINYGEQSPRAKLYGEVIGENVDQESTANPQEYQDKTPSFKTASGDSYIENENGQTKRITPTGTIYHPLDATFYVDQNTAMEEALGRFIPSGTDGKTLLAKDGNKLVKFTFDSEGNITNKEEVPTIDKGVGAVPVAVNELKNHTGNAVVGQSHIGLPITEVNEDSTAGAAFTKESKVGERARTSTTLSDETKSFFGDEDSGTLRYFPKTRIELTSKEGKKIADIGIQEAYQHFLSDAVDTERPSNTDIAMGIELRRAFDKAENSARLKGDTLAANDLSLQHARIIEKLGRIGETTGRGLGLYNELAKDLTPRQKAAALRGKIQERSFNELSADTNLSVDELKRLPNDVDTIKEALKKSQLEDKENTPEGEKPVDSDKTKALKERYKQLKRIADKVQTKLLEDQAKFTPEDEAALIKFHTLLEDAPDNATKKALQKGIDKINKKFQTKEEKLNSSLLDNTKKEVKSLWNNLHSFVASNLVGLGSIIKKASFDTLITLITPGVYLVTGRKAEAIAFGNELLNSFYNWRAENPVEALKTSKFFNSFMHTLATGETSKFKGKDFLAEGPAGVRYVGIVPRVLSAITEAFSVTNAHAQAKALAASFLKSGATGDFRETLASYLSEGSKHFETALADIRSTNDLLVKATGEGMSEREIMNAAWDRAYKMLPENLIKQADFFGQKQTLINKPTGFLGGIYESVANLKWVGLKIGESEFQPFKYPLTFIRVGMNLLNSSFEFTPLGFIKAAHATEFEGTVNGKASYREKAALESSQQFGRALIGTGIMAYMIYKASQNLDKDFPEFMIHGEGPPNFQAKQQALAKGWIPESVQIGDKYWSYKDTILSVPLGTLGGIFDAMRYQKDLDPEDLTQMIGLAALSTLQPITSSSMFKSIGDFFEAVSNFKSNPEYASSKMGDIFFTNPAKGLIPFYGSLKFAGNNVQDMTKGVFARITSGLPFASDLGSNRPALNYFGEPIERPFKDKFGVIPGIGYGQSDINDVSPEWRWLAQNNYSLPQDQSYTIKLFKEGDPKDKAIEQARKEKYADLGAKFGNVLTPDERYQLIETAGPLIKNKVSQYMERYGFSGNDPKVQDGLKKDISKIFNDTKKKLFMHR